MEYFHVFFIMEFPKLSKTYENYYIIFCDNIQTLWWMDIKLLPLIANILLSNNYKYNKRNMQEKT